MGTEDRKISISIAVYNNQALTAKCIESIFEFTPKGAFDLTVTDNASTDGTPGYLAGLEAAHKNVRVIRNDRNLGFLAPHNRVFSESSSEFFLVLNNDLTLCEGWMPTMLEKFSDHKVISCGIRNTCIALDDKGVGVPGEEAEYVEGSCLLVRSSMVRELEGGLFDPIYRFAYFEDSDFGLRARKAGHKIAVVDLPIIHMGGATTRIVRNIDLEGYRLRNQRVFLARWGSYLSTRRGRPIHKNRIVIRRAGAQGDVIMATPIIRVLRREYPKGVIVFETTCKDVLSGNPDVNEVFTAIRALETDHVIDLNLAYESRPYRHAIDAYAEVAGVTFLNDLDAAPRLYPNDTARIVASQRMPAGEKYAIIHPGAIPGWVGRQWDWKRWTRVVKELTQKGYKTVLVGNELTPPVATALDFRNIPFVHFVVLMERATIFCGLDSMPFHVAQACRIPTVVLFGSVEPELRIVRGAPVIPVVAENVGCLGCHHCGPAPRTCTSSCWRPTELCMERLTDEQVIQAISQVEKKYIDIAAPA